MSILPTELKQQIQKNFQNWTNYNQGNKIAIIKKLNETSSSLFSSFPKHAQELKQCELFFGNLYKEEYGVSHENGK